MSETRDGQRYYDTGDRTEHDKVGTDDTCMYCGKWLGVSKHVCPVCPVCKTTVYHPVCKNTVYHANVGDGIEPDGQCVDCQAKAKTTPGETLGTLRMRNMAAEAARASGEDKTEFEAATELQQDFAPHATDCHCRICLQATIARLKDGLRQMVSNTAIYGEQAGELAARILKEMTCKNQR